MLTRAYLENVFEVDGGHHRSDRGRRVEPDLVQIDLGLGFPHVKQGDSIVADHLPGLQGASSIWLGRWMFIALVKNYHSNSK